MTGGVGVVSNDVLEERQRHNIDRLDRLEEQVADIAKGIKEILDRHDREIYGDEDNPGLKYKVRDLEKAEEDRRWFKKVMTVAVIGVVVEPIFFAVIAWVMFGSRVMEALSK